MRSSTLLAVVALVAAVAIIVSTLAAGPALAGKGNGNGGGQRSDEATLWVEPSNPFPANGFEFAVMGSGFAADSTVYISMTPNGVASNVMSDSEGHIMFGWITGAPGTYTFSACQGFKGNHWTTCASVDVQVTE